MCKEKEKEIFSLSIYRLDSRNGVQIYCEENCGYLAQFLVEKGGEKTYLCKGGLIRKLLGKKIKREYQIQLT